MLTSYTAASATDISKLLSAQDVVWATPSVNAAGSMPIGNGEVVVNAWVEAASGDLLLLIARTDAMSEISRVLKLGRVRIKLTPNPFQDLDFRQHLKLIDGVIELKGSGETLRLFVDSDSDTIHLVGKLNHPRRVAVELENWREKDRPLPEADKRSGWSVLNAPFPLVESADHVLALTNQIGWYHHNATSVVPRLLENQSLTGLRGTFDPLIGRTFGAVIQGTGLVSQSKTILASQRPISNLEIAIATHTNRSKVNWTSEVTQALAKSDAKTAAQRTRLWWNQYWNNSYVFVDAPAEHFSIHDNNFPIRKGHDSNGQNVFAGSIENWGYTNKPLTSAQISNSAQYTTSENVEFHPTDGFTLTATIHPTADRPGRIFDKLTAGQEDGFLFDTHPGRSLRLIVGKIQLSAPNCLALNESQTVTATFDAKSGEAALFRNGFRVAYKAPDQGSPISRGYILQRYVQAIQGRGEYPIKFNGGFYTVEPSAMGINSNPDFRNWGDCHWFQNVRHIYHPMLASGDYSMMEPFFKLYESALPLAESRAKTYHNSQGAYFPETMSIFGTYGGGDYGWDRTGLQPNQVQCPWWDDAWNQGPELVGLMLDRWDYTRDEKFLKSRVLPMAESVLKYFDTRFKKDANKRIVLDPTQVVETYWEGVINDLPTVAGLNSINNRLTSLPKKLVSKDQQIFFEKMKNACPELPFESKDGQRQLAPAQVYKPVISNVENGELYAAWPFGVVSLQNPKFLPEAKRAYANRKNKLDTGWGYDGNVAAILGMADEAARILNVKVRNSHPAYRWPATWGPNFDWLPDQNHGGNILNTTHLMLLQSESLEAGGKIRLLPSWPKHWDVQFKLHAAANTTVECSYRDGKIEQLTVTPKSRAKDIVMPEFLN